MTPWLLLAFCNNTGLLTVVIENGSIGKECFVGCTALINATVKKGAIGDRAFYNLSALKNVALFGDDSSKGITIIGDYAFYSCPIESLIVPDSATSIGEYAFNLCKSLKNVSTGKNVRYLGQYAFSVCSSLTSVVLGDNLERIEQYAFNSCSKLNSIIIPEKVNYLGENAFYNVNHTSSFKITFKSPIPPNRGGLIFGDWSVCMYVPSVSLSTYKSVHWQQINYSNNTTEYNRLVSFVTYD